MHHAALNLRLDVVGVDGITRVNAHDHAVNLDLAFGVDSDLTNASGVAAIAFGFSNAAENARRQRSTPVGGLGNGLQNAAVARGFGAQHVQAKSQRVFAGGMRQLVDKTLAHVRVL